MQTEKMTALQAGKCHSRENIQSLVMAESQIYVPDCKTMFCTILEKAMKVELMHIIDVTGVALTGEMNNTDYLVTTASVKG